MPAVYYAHRPRVPRSTRAVSARARAGARAARVGAAVALQRRTGGGGGSGAQQLRARQAGADRVLVEVRIVDAGAVVAAPRVVRVGLHEIKGLARGGRRGAARRLGRDPHGARRARVAAGVTGHVRTCARQHRTRDPSARAAAAVHASDPSGTGGSTRQYRVPSGYPRSTLSVGLHVVPWSARGRRRAVRAPWWNTKQGGPNTTHAVRRGAVHTEGE
jgi:hypothetical protein